MVKSETATTAVSFHICHVVCELEAYHRLGQAHARCDPAWLSDIAPQVIIHPHNRPERPSSIRQQLLRFIYILYLVFVASSPHNSRLIHLTPGLSRRCAFARQLFNQENSEGYRRYASDPVGTCRAQTVTCLPPTPRA